MARRCQPGAVPGNAAINDYFYGASPAFATGQRPASTAKSGLILTCLGLTSIWAADDGMLATTGAATLAAVPVRAKSGATDCPRQAVRLVRVRHAAMGRKFAKISFVMWFSNTDSSVFHNTTAPVAQQYAASPIRPEVAVANQGQ